MASSYPPSSSAATALRRLWRSSASSSSSLPTLAPFPPSSSSAATAYSSGRAHPLGPVVVPSCPPRRPAPACSLYRAPAAAAALLRRQTVGTSTAAGRCCRTVSTSSSPPPPPPSGRSSSIYATGVGWTGALGLGRDAMVDGFISDGSLLTSGSLAGEGGEEGDDGDGGEEDFVEVPCPPPSAVAAKTARVVAGAAGWGHTAIVVTDGGGEGEGEEEGGRRRQKQQQQQQQHNRHQQQDEETPSSSAAESANASASSRLLVAGRPHDFQTLLRLKRLPSFLRRYVVSNSLRYDDGTTRPDGDTAREGRGAVANLIDLFLKPGTEEMDDADGRRRSGSKVENDDDGGDDDFAIRRYGLYPSLTEIELPDGDTPALPRPFDSADPTDPAAAAGRRHHVLAASAGLTAVIGQSGTLYSFGLNHRGQCGVGEKDSNNVWEPRAVRGLSMRPVEELEEEEEERDEKESSSSNNNKRQKKKKKKKGRAALTQDRPIVSVSLGLQYGLALDDIGQLYAWGKGSRGQLGVRNPGELSPRVLPDTEYSARPVTEFYAPLRYDSAGGLVGGKNGGGGEGGGGSILRPRREQLLMGNDARVIQMGAGMNHSAAVTESNHAWVWGKNVIPPPLPPRDDEQGGAGGKTAVTTTAGLSDSPLPVPVPGLPPHLAILDVACGSHHTAFLLEDGSVYGTGVATDTVRPLPPPPSSVDGGPGPEFSSSSMAVELIPPGMIDMPPRQFVASFDRTTIVDRSGMHVWEVQLWSHEELRDGAAFEPGWVDGLLLREEEDGEVQRRRGEGGIRMVHRGWMHTVVVTE